MRRNIKTIINGIKKLFRVKDKDGFIDVSYWQCEKITRENLVKAIRYAAAKYARGRLIDIGCGSKPYERILTQYVDTYFGIDYEPAAASNYKDQTRADLYCDCTNITLESNSFDTILSTQVMEHVLETQKYISECFRLLRPGGVGIFTVPMTWRCHAEPFDYYRFTHYALHELFKKAGFAILEITPLEGAYASLIQLKMSTLYSLEVKGFFSVLLMQFRHKIVFPILNMMALKLDRIFWNDKLCLNYLLVVRKN